MAKKRWIYIPTASDFTNTYSASLDGSDEDINFGDTANESGSDAMSYSVWIKTSDTEATPYFKGAASTNHALLIISGQIWMWFSSSAGNYITKYTDASIVSGSWQHIVCTYDGSKDPNNMEIYVDGTRITATTTLDAGTFTDSSDSGDALIGSQNRTSRWFNGVIGDFCKIPWELNQTEVTELYNSGSELDMTTFSGWNTMKSDVRSMWVNWEADDLTHSSGSVTDLTDNGYVGTPSNTEVGDKVEDSP
jgi:hypothetical protein